MANLTQLYVNFIPYENLEVGMKLKISKVHDYQLRLLLSDSVKIAEFDDIVTVTNMEECSRKRNNVVCPECLCNGKIIQTRTQDVKDVPNCCFYEFTGLHGEEIRYE
jgi:hypothetical protein